MKKIISILYFFIVAMLLFPSCNDDFLETKPSDKFSDEAVWSDPNLVELYVNNLYSVLLEPYFATMTCSLVDETYNTFGGAVNFTQSIINPDDLAGFGGTGSTQCWEWSSSYSNIRICNVFFDHIAEVPFSNESLRDRMKGETYFFRAFFYNNLVSSYGGVPIIDYSFELADEFNVARNSYEECINFIIKDLDLAIELLPVEQADNGRVTKGAAMALKSRVLLYAASDLHNNNSLFAGYSNPELLGYTGGNANERWIKARDAAKAVMDMNRYGLYKAEPSPEDSITKNYSDLFLSKTATEEDIFICYYDAETAPHDVQKYNGPNGYHNWGANTPVQEFVDSYEMSDGTKFDWNNPEQAANPYQNRDPRFYASVLYNGAYWKPRPSDGQDIEAIYPDLMMPGHIQTGHWQVWDAENSQEVTVHGLDTRQGPIEDWNGSYTGYYLRKFLDPADNAQYNKQETPFRYIRYAEILLNYAEACIELGEETEARFALNQIRKRAGMPDIEDTGEALKERYRNERKIELAFEEHRFFDIRRWGIGNQTIVPAKSINITYELNTDHTTSATPTYSLSVIDQRAWQDKAYFMPVAREEMNKNELLIQNPFYN